MQSSRSSFAILLLAMLPAACAPAPVDRTPTEQTLRYRMPEDPPTLDPFRAGDDNSNVYHYLIFDGLVEYVPGSLEVRPAVAESWTLSPDNLTYTFKLRKGVRFHNGREVVADDVVYSIHRALSKKARSEKSSFFSCVKGADDYWAGRSRELSGVVAPDSRTVAITLSYPYEKFLTILASEAGAILPKEVYEDPTGAYERHPVGCGPFRYDSYEPTVSLTLARFADHWKGAAPRGAISKIIFRFMPDSSTAFQEYRAGGLDFTQEIPPLKREQVLKEMPADVHNATRLSILYVGFNHGAAPFKNNPALRRAIVHAIDRDYIVRVLQEGKDVVASGIIPPGMLGHDPNRPPAAYDPNLATRLLAQAGYSGGKGLPELVYSSNQSRGFSLIADRIQADLSRIGVKVRIKMTDFGAFIAAMQSGKADAAGAELFRMTWYSDWPDPDNFLAAQFITGGPGNYSLYSNPAFDRAMEKARIETDGARRGDLYRDAETMLLEDAALVPIYWYGQDVLLKPEFTGMKLSPLGTFGIAWEEVTHRK